MIGGDDEVKEAGGGLCPDEEVELFLWAVEKTRDKEEKVGLVLFCLQRLVEALPCNTMRKQVYVFFECVGPGRTSHLLIAWCAVTCSCLAGYSMLVCMLQAVQCWQRR